MKRLSVLLVSLCMLTRAESPWVYLSNNVRNSFLHIHHSLPNHSWSLEFERLCKRIAEQTVATTVEEAEKSVCECLEALQCNHCGNADWENALIEYREQIRNGDASLVLLEDNDLTRACNSCNDCQKPCIKYKKTKAFCNLLAHDLQVDGSGFIAHLTANTMRVTGDAFFDGTVTFNGDVINAGDVVFDDLTVNGTFTANGVSNIGTNDVANEINIGTGGAGRVVNIGNDLAGSITTITGDTSTLVLGSPADSANLNATGTINIANNNVAQTVNIATGTPLVKTVNIGTGVGANVLTLGSDTAASITENALSMNYGTGAAAKTITIGNTTAGTTITLNTPANVGVSLNGGASIFTGAAVPNFAAPAGSLYLRTGGANNDQVAYVNFDGGALNWTPLTDN